MNGAGGLLLLYSQYESKRKNRLVGSKMFEIGAKKRCAKDRVPSKRLIVCNPLTKRWRSLSEMHRSKPEELKHLWPALLRFVCRPYEAGVTEDDLGLVAIHILAVNNECSNYEIVT